MNTSLNHLSNRQLLNIAQSKKISQIQHFISSEMLNQLKKNYLLNLKNYNFNKILLSIPHSIDASSIALDLFWGMSVALVSASWFISMMAFISFSIVVSLGLIVAFLNFRKSRKESEKLNQKLLLANIQTIALQLLLKRQHDMICHLDQQHQNEFYQHSKSNKTIHYMSIQKPKKIWNSKNIQSAATASMIGLACITGSFLTIFIGMTEILKTIGLIGLFTAVTSPYGMGVAIVFSCVIGSIMAYRYYKNKQQLNLVKNKIKHLKQQNITQLQSVYSNEIYLNQLKLQVNHNSSKTSFINQNHDTLISFYTNEIKIKVPKNQSKPSQSITKPMKIVRKI